MDEIIDIEDLFNTYYREIYHFSLYFSSNKEDAEDITQDTFMKAIRNIKSLKDPSRAKYWLLSIARHTAIDHHRKHKLRSIIPTLIDHVKDTLHTESLDEQILVKEKWEEVQHALLRIKPRYRTVLILRGLQELTIKETAEVLQCTELKVRVDFHRAVNDLKKELSSQEVNENEAARKSITRS